jgi:hypothetical protein
MSLEHQAEEDGEQNDRPEGTEGEAALGDRLGEEVAGGRASGRVSTNANQNGSTLEMAGTYLRASKIPSRMVTSTALPA